MVTALQHVGPILQLEHLTISLWCRLLHNFPVHTGVNLNSFNREVDFPVAIVF